MRLKLGLFFYRRKMKGKKTDFEWKKILRHFNLKKKLISEKALILENEENTQKVCYIEKEGKKTQESPQKKVQIGKAKNHWMLC